MNFDIATWWDTLETLEKIYWGIAFPFTLFFLLQMALTFLGGDMDASDDAADVDLDVESDHGIGFQFLSLKNLVAFFTIFAWTGIACLDSGVSNGLSIVISFIAGIIMMLIMGAVFYFLGKAVESGTLDIKNAIGKIGEVYMEIKSSRENIGKVQIQVQGTLRTLEAMTDDEESLSQGAVVNVTGIANSNILIVSKHKS